MIGPWPLLFAYLGGMLAGAAFFGGLMLTVLRVPASRSPRLLLLSSFLARAGVALALIMALGRGRWAGYAACILGFLTARRLAVLLWGPRRGRPEEVETWRS